MPAFGPVSPEITIRHADPSARRVSIRTACAGTGGAPCDTAIVSIAATTPSPSSCPARDATSATTSAVPSSRSSMRHR